MAEEPPKKRQRLDTEDSTTPGATSCSQENVIIAAAPDESQDMIAASTVPVACPTDLPLIRAELEEIRKRIKDNAKRRPWEESDDDDDAFNLGHPLIPLRNIIRDDPDREQSALADMIAEVKELAATAKAEGEQRELEGRRLQDADVADFMDDILWTGTVDKLVIDYLDAVDWSENIFVWQLQRDEDWRAFWTHKAQDTTPPTPSSGKQSMHPDAQIIETFQFLKWQRDTWDRGDSPLLRLRTPPA